MAARAELGFPARAAHGEATAKDLMNIAHCKGDVVQALFAIGHLEQKHIMVTAIGRAAHEMTAPRIAVRHHKTQAFVESRGLSNVGREQHNMANFHRLGALIDRRGRIDALGVAPSVARRAGQIQLFFRTDLKAVDQTMRIGLRGWRLALAHAPDDFAQRCAALHGGAARQIRVHGMHDAHLRAIERFKQQGILGFADQRQAPIEEKALGRGHVLRRAIAAIGDAVDAL